MPIINTTQTYGSISKLFHWLIVLLVIAMIIIGFTMGHIDDKMFRREVYALHKSFGLTILGLMLLRLLWRLINKRPELPTHIPKWQQKAANASHWLMYALLLAMPMSGLVMSTAAGHPPKFFNLFIVSLPIEKSKLIASSASTVHTVIAWCIIATVSTHILAALKHHFIDRDTVLMRMLPSTGKHGEINQAAVGERIVD